MSVSRGIIVVALLLPAATAFGLSWCVPGTGPNLLNTYGPTSPVITNVTLNTIDRITVTSDKELYVDTALSTTLEIGQSYTLSMTYEPDLPVCPSYQLRVWIDWDQDGSFLDFGEIILSENDHVFSSAMATVDVPVTAAIGTTRMRVAMKMEVVCGHDLILACPMAEPVGWHGEIEDYTIEVVSTGGCNASPVARLLAIESGVDEVELTWTDDPAYASYSVYAVISQDPSMIAFADADGRAVYPGDIDNVCKEVAQPCVGPGMAVDIVFYQVLGVCANGDEGPLE